MRRLILLLAFALPVFAARTVDVTLVAKLSDIPPRTPAVAVWVPLPRTTDVQMVRNLEIDSRFRWDRRTEDEFGNQYLFARIPAPRSGMEVLRLRFRATRREIALDRIAGGGPSPSELERNRRADRLVTLSPRIRQLAADVTRSAHGPLEEARAIYDYVVSHMKYDKTTPGWGRGDTERACDIRAGNCTDFHSLFISLVRARGIAARFVIGFPIAALTTGYHCWAEFYLPGKGWIPVDPSEASKSNDPARRAFLFGNLDADRIEFTRGRDIRVTPATRAPLNYFIYPHVEANGQELADAVVSFGVRRP